MHLMHAINCIKCIPVRNCLNWSVWHVHCTNVAYLLICLTSIACQRFRLFSFLAIAIFFVFIYVVFLSSSMQMTEMLTDLHDNWNNEQPTTDNGTAKVNLRAHCRCGQIPHNASSRYIQRFPSDRPSDLDSDSSIEKGNCGGIWIAKKEINLQSESGNWIARYVYGLKISLGPRKYLNII